MNNFFNATVLSGKTYKMYLDTDIISGYTDRQSAVGQSIYCILSTERYKYVIYSFNYGLQRDDLYGKDVDYACSVLQRRISSAVIFDDRVKSADSFVFDTNMPRTIKIKFTAHTIYGDLTINYEVYV